jgi:Glycosyl hydrolase family 71
VAFRESRRGTPSSRTVTGIGAWLVVLLLASATLALIAQPRATDSKHSAPDPGLTSLTPVLAFQPPARSAMLASNKLVFAHYLPILTLSIDNRAPAVDYYTRHYLTPEGENGKHKAYGGFLRDRPIPRQPVASADWMLQDMQIEVRQAIAAGIDGFTLDLLQLPKDGQSNNAVWNNSQTLLQAAHLVDSKFKIMLMPDMGVLADRSPDDLAKYIAQLGTFQAAHRLPDGRLVVSPLAAERHPPGWWQDFVSLMETRYATPVAFTPTFIDIGNAPAYASVTYGVSGWGARNPAFNDPEAVGGISGRGRIQSTHAQQKLWMQPVSVQDERPRAGVYDEAENTTNLRRTWEIAIRGGADWVQLVTWNDYSEGSQFAPSLRRGWNYLDISAYYLAWFKTGVRPPITQDTVYLTHRMQFVDAVTTYPQKVLMHNRNGTTPRDAVEALVFLTHPATVTVSTGQTSISCTAPAGVSTCVAPLATGTPRVVVRRAGVTVASLTSPFAVSATPYTQDLQYVASGSREGAMGPSRESILEAP